MLELEKIDDGDELMIMPQRKTGDPSIESIPFQSNLIELKRLLLVTCSSTFNYQVSCLNLTPQFQLPFIPLLRQMMRTHCMTRLDNCSEKAEQMHRMAEEFLAFGLD